MRLFLSLLILFILLSGAVCAGEPEIAGKTVKAWTAALKHKDARVRYQAVAALYEAGAEAAPLVKEFARLLKDPQVAVRRAAAMTLGGLKEEAAPAVAALIYAMKDADPAVRFQAGQALTEVGEAASAPLAKVLEDKDAVIRCYAVVTMNKLGLQGKEVVAALGKASKDGNPAVRSAALFALAKIETDNPEIYSILGAALGDKEKTVRNSAVSILIGMGKDSTETLAKATGDPRSEARLLAVQTLAALGEQLDEKGLAALRKALADDETRVRQAAAQGLAGLGVKARTLGGDKELFQDLVKLLKEKDVQLRRAGVLALGKIGSEDADEIAGVAAGLKDSDLMVRALTTQALAGYAGENVPDEIRRKLQGYWIEALGDKDRRIQFLAAQAFFQDKEHAVEPLLRAVENENGPRRLWAATVLGEIGFAAAEAIPALKKMSEEKSPDARRAALIALQKIQAE